MRHLLLERKTTTEMLHQHQPSFSSTQLGQHIVKNREKETLAPSPWQGRNPAMNPLFHSPPKNTETIKAKPCTREVKCWVWVHQTTSTLCLTSFLTRQAWCCSRAAGTKSSQKGVLHKCLDRLKLKRTNYMTLPTVCKRGPDSQRGE